MLSVAVIEDNDELRGTMLEALRAMGHRAVGLDSAEAMVDSADAGAIDILVVDLNLPGEDGLSLTRRLRAVQPGAGIILVTGRRHESDRRTSYEMGADIFLTKPISTDELRAAISALGRRLEGSGTGEGAALQLDMRRRALTGPAGTVEVRPQEAALLGAFVRAPDMQLESWQILEIFERAGWSYSRANVGVAVFRLGARLREAGAAARPIRAIRNWGYRLHEKIILN